MRIRITADKNNKKTILTLLEEQGYSVPCNCHGKHHCRGNLYPFDCSLVPHSPTTIEWTPPIDSLNALAFHNRTTTTGDSDTLLIDLGTTTVAYALINKTTGELCQMSTTSNPLIRYGADVISRIQSSCEGEGNTMQALLAKEIGKETEHLCKRNGQTSDTLTYCFIAGNTTMIHLLMGYDCTPLSRSPFAIEAVSPAPFVRGKCRIHIAPWLSAFIGGDIVAGIHSCNMSHMDETTLFLDLGTNGEMILCHEGKYYATSVAAGPAFEGGNLQYGVPAVAGAIQNVTIRPLRPAITTIENKLPVGICGSGAIRLCAELLRNGYVTREGILTERFPEDGYFLGTTPQGKSLVFTANDFRQIQLAVAAVAAGIDTLCHQVDIEKNELQALFLAGGFGFHISLADATTLGLFSDLSPDVIKIMGNTCLQGLYRCATENLALSLSTPVETVSLADDAYFQKQFLQHMTFPS